MKIDYIPGSLYLARQMAFNGGQQVSDLTGANDATAQAAAAGAIADALTMLLMENGRRDLEIGVSELTEIRDHLAQIAPPEPGPDSHVHTPRPPA